MERIEGLEQEHRDIRTAFRTHYATHDGKKLMAEQSAFRTSLSRGDPVIDGMPEEIMLTFPGMPNYKGPVS